MIQFWGARGTELWITGWFFFRTNVKQSMTPYAEMFRYFVKIFCKLKLTVSVCRTRSAKRSRRPNVIRNWLWNIYLYFIFSLQLFSVVRCTRTSALWPTKRNTRRSAPPSRSRSVRHGPLGNWNKPAKPVMTLTLNFKMILLFQFLIRDRRPNTTPWQRLSARLNMRRCMMNNALQVLFSHQRLVPHDIDISVVETVYDNKCEKVYETVYEV